MKIPSLSCQTSRFQLGLPRFCSNRCRSSSAGRIQGHRESVADAGQPHQNSPCHTRRPSSPTAADDGRYMLLFASLALLLFHMHPCTRAQLSDSFHGWEVRASAQPTNAPAQTQPHYPLPSREVRSTKPPAQTPPRATRHPQHLTDHDPGDHASNPWNVPGTCLPIPSERSPPNMGSRSPRPHFSSSSSESSSSISTTPFSRKLRGARWFAAPRTNRTASLQTSVR